jgi:1-acyl-sn-glycerol-3-phosphate acyltransferase|tara:strand:- start:1055 stop:1762 length:708 start_codon:yes stop_codon:yes gene_type:complete
MIYLRSGIFYIGYLSSGVLASFIACTVGPFLSLSNRLKIFSLWPRFANWLLSVTCGIEVIVEGKENLPSKACVIVSNHQGQWETFSMQYLFHPLCTLLKRELLYIPLWGWAMRLLKPIAINRGRPREALKQALNEGSDRLDRGIFVLFFPEGTRVEAGLVNKYSRSSFELALRSNVPVLPIVHNSGDCWPAHKFLKYPGTIFLTIGKPQKVINAKESADEVERWTRASLKRSLDI